MNQRQNWNLENLNTDKVFAENLFIMCTDKYISNSVKAY